MTNKMSTHSITPPVELLPVIMCGGKGSRLWPLSRGSYPKQFMELSPGRSLFRDTVRRAVAVAAVDSIVVCNQDHRFMAAEQLRAEGVGAQIVLEPEGRNTAPAVAAAALLADADSVLLVMPADHAIEESPEFRDALSRGMEAARQGDLVCFGVTPGEPETGYGYIRKGERTETGFHVQQFVEKPDLQRARYFIDSGEYFWNSGIFMFRAGRYLEELRQFAPEIFDASSAAVEKSARDLDFIRLDADSFLKSPSEPIDCAVMEKTDSLTMVTLDCKWSDLGSWSALHGISEQDEHGNGLVGDVVCHDVEGCYLHSSGRLIAALGLKDTVIVETSDAILAADNAHIPQLKKLVGVLTAQGRSEVAVHPTVYRPWGSFQSITVGTRYQVKILSVKPGEVLSLQKHHHRAEHWVVVSGTALVVNGEREFLMGEDESTYIPLGNVHRLTNPGKIPLEIIEVQTGSYLGEDDIVRFEDKYSRQSSNKEKSELE